MNKKITLAIQELKGSLITKFGHDVELKLFGSVARGDDRPEEHAGGGPRRGDQAEQKFGMKMMDRNDTLCRGDKTTGRRRFL